LARGTKPYRFLLRMPVELRQRLQEAAKRSDRSLNREIVERLEASLREEEPAAGQRGVRIVRALHIDRGRRMTRRRRQALVAVVVALVAVSALVAGVTLSGKQSAAASPATAGGAFPSAFAKHLAGLRAAPYSQNLGGPASWEETQDLARAYPAQSVDYQWIAEARSDWKSTEGRAFPRGGKKGTWTSIGPSTALYPISPFRTREDYVAGKYVAGGRMTSLALAPDCTESHCRLYIAAAGGGVWATDKALKDNPKWEFLSGSFELNAIGSITIDPNDPSGDTVWVGTGEANAAGSAAAGVGIYKSTDAGETWTKLAENEFKGRAIGSIAIHPTNPDIVYAASTRAVRGISASTPGATSTPFNAPYWGLYKSTDGGETWSYIHNGAPTTAVCSQDITGAQPCSPRGVRRVALDPNNPDIVYAGSYARGVWRSPDAGATWTQIFAPIEDGPATANTERPEFALADLGATTRMYLQIGASGAIDSTFHTTDDAAGAAVFTQKSSPDVANPGWGSQGLCANPVVGIGQCWYDQFVYTPKGHPDIVYVGGVFLYDEQTANHRGVVMSEDGGSSWYDMTEDVTDDVHPQQLHPDQHGIVTHPDNPYLFWEVSDGGLMRSSGELTDRTSVCPGRGLTGADLARCQQMLLKVPTTLESLNKDLQTLQFFTLSVSPHDKDIVQGGTQDNGTWQTEGSKKKWLNTNISDGGHNGFDAAIPNFRFSMFFFPQLFVNYQNGSDADWNWVSDTFFTNEETLIFYPAAISDPNVSKTLFLAQDSVWRTKTAGQGAMSDADFRAHCNLYTGDFAVFCGDWAQLGGTTLTGDSFGDRAGGDVSMIERSEADNSTLWAGTSTGRLFISKNANADPAASVVWDRIDLDSAVDPGRFVSGIEADPEDANRAWVTYSGYDETTQAEPGHVFEVEYDPATGTASVTRLDGGPQALPNTPATDVVYDEVTGDLYVSNDFGVVKRPGGTTTWVETGDAMPNVMVPSLTIDREERRLYAATHGFGAWRMKLEKK
jgi:hypothetical protein